MWSDVVVSLQVWSLLHWSTLSEKALSQECLVQCAGLGIILDCKPEDAEVHLYGYNWNQKLWQTHKVQCLWRQLWYCVSTLWLHYLRSHVMNKTCKQTVLSFRRKNHGFCDAGPLERSLCPCRLTRRSNFVEARLRSRNWWYMKLTARYSCLLSSSRLLLIWHPSQAC